MTFEEFFQKKKIDLSALGSERPALLDEFRKHFEAMGEKSFDHTKKYWFNKLRKSYPLKELPVPEKNPETPAAAAAGTPDLAEAKSPLSPPSASQASAPAASSPKLGFKPRFKAGKTAGSPKPEQASEKEKTGPAQAGSSHRPDKRSPDQQQPAKNEPSATSEDEQPKTPKPAYKPRFKPGVTRVQKKDDGE